jgi:hypothetical protein
MKDEDIEVEDRYKLWIDEAAYELGMDICAMDGTELNIFLRDKFSCFYFYFCSTGLLRLILRFISSRVKFLT